MDKIYEKAPAKINLFLDVLHKRADGYHEVEMVMTMIDLADRLEIEELPNNQIVLSSQAGFIPLNQKNLAFQAAMLIKRNYGIQKGVHIHLDKNIPVAAGLAGGSSDAAATFRGLNRLWDMGLTNLEMELLGAQIGSDVPFCLRGGTALAFGRGEKLQTLNAPPSCWVILAKLNLNVSTKDIYQRFKNHQIQQRPSLSRMLNALEKNCFSEVCASMGNVLEEVTMRQHPEVKKIKEHMLKSCADGVLMSGSGPTVFALVSKERKVRRVYNGLRGFCKEVYVARMLT